MQGQGKQLFQVKISIFLLLRTFLDIFHDDLKKDLFVRVHGTKTFNLLKSAAFPIGIFDELPFLT